MPATACDLCSIYAAPDFHGEPRRGWLVGVAEQFTHFGTVQENGRVIKNGVGQYLDSSITQLFVGYDFTDRVGVQLNMPIIHRSFKRPEGFAIDRGSEAGFGDLSLSANVTAWRKSSERFTANWTLLGGVKFPTGSSDRLKEELTEVEVSGAPESGIHGHDLALGSGSWDGIVGSSVYARCQRAFVSATLQYAIRSRGDFDYRYANDLTWAAGPGVYLALEERHTIALQLIVSGETKGKDTFQGTRAEDTGVTSVFLGPQLNFTWANKLHAQLAADLPLDIKNTALQTVPDYRLRAALHWQF
jgi:hypothetical protein